VRVFIEKLIVRIAEIILSVPLLIISTIIPKNKSLAVYGEWFGQRFADECLQEYDDNTFNKKIVIVKSFSLFERLRGKYDVRMAYSVAGIIAQLRADNAFVNVSSRDLALGAVAGASMFVQLGHGVPIKTFLLSEKERGGFYRFKLWLKLRIYDRYTKVYCPFAYLRALYSLSYAVPLDRVEVRAPRFRRFSKSEYTGRISYMPTHRDEGRQFDDSGFKMLFEAIASGNLKKDKELVIRLHPYERKYSEHVTALIAQYGIGGRVYVDNDHEGFDVALISDYSGVIFPYHDNGVPVILFQWDSDSFSREFIAPKSIGNIVITKDANTVLERINEI
jgi:CDP-glycerol glycerophosphotransferase